ncbi:DNA-3-methyladenine glycosylase family protein [Propionibacteriaceae bacterium Y1923]
MPSSTVVTGLAGSLDAVMTRLQRGHGDPTLRRVHDGWWRAMHPAPGPVLVQFRREGDDVLVRAWGDGADWALEHAGAQLGADDRPELFPRAPVRLGVTGLLGEALAAAIIEQKVTGAEAFTSLRRLVRRLGEPAPGAEDEQHPAHGLVAPPTAEQWAGLPGWEAVQVGIDDRRAATLRRTMAKVPALERVLARHEGLDVTARGEALERALTSLPGIGAWTSAKVRQQVLGDPDAWSVGDYHVPGVVEWRLGGPAEEVLEPFRPHRYRLELSLLAQGLPPRHGPRRSLPTHLPLRADWRGGSHGRRP